MRRRPIRFAWPTPTHQRGRQRGPQAKDYENTPSEPFSRPINPGRWKGAIQREIQRVDRIHACIREEGGVGLEKVKGEGGGIKMSFSLFERHVTPCPSSPVKRAIFESSKLDFSAIVRHFFTELSGFFRPGLLNLEQKSCPIYSTGSCRKNL